LHHGLDASVIRAAVNRHAYLSPGFRTTHQYHSR
jgi:hypothetical protein